MILMIDNFDSFTFNIVQYFQELQQDVEVYRNDEISLAEIEQLNPDHIVLSPGPGRPSEAGVMLDVIARFYDKKPMMGICLGHQAIAQFFGAEIVPSKQLMHGKTSPVFHRQKDLFQGLPSPYKATRYHSLVVNPESLPDELAVTAWTQEASGGFDEIMGLQHRALPIYGVQFHPESILTEYGHALLKNFINHSCFKGVG